MSRYALLEIILPPAVLCVILIIFVYVICLKKKYFCVTKTQSNPESVTYDAPTVSGHVLMAPLAAVGALVQPPSYADCVREQPGISILEIPPTYEELFGWNAPTSDEEWVNSVASNDNYIPSARERVVTYSSSDIIAHSSSLQSGISNPGTNSEPTLDRRQEHHGTLS